MGGFGMKKLVPQNRFYMMKLAFQMVTKVDVLWVRILCYKYKILEICPKTIDRPVCSYVWHSLAKVWHLFHDRIIWSVRNGSSICFAQDDWVQRLGSFYNHLFLRKDIPTKAKVSDFVTDVGVWNVGMLKQFFPNEVLECITACHPLMNSQVMIKSYGRRVRMELSLLKQLTEVQIYKSIPMERIDGHKFGKLSSLANPTFSFGLYVGSDCLQTLREFEDACWMKQVVCDVEIHRRLHSMYWVTIVFLERYDLNIYRQLMFMSFFLRTR